jgi:outer membrane lipoprotein-sorting protein
MFMLALMSISLSASFTHAQNRGVLGEILHRMDEHNKALQSLKADVRREIFNAQLGDTDVSTGRTSYVPKSAKTDMLVRIDWITPREEHLAITGDSYDMYIPKTKARYIGNVNSVTNGGKVPANALAFMSMSRQQLTATYLVDFVGKETVAGSTTWHLLLTPREKASYKSANLWVDANGMPIQAKITAPNDDSTTVLLTNLQKNVTVNKADFKLQVPPGIKPIKG